MLFIIAIAFSPVISYTKISYGKIKDEKAIAGKGKDMTQTMTRLELLTLLLSIQALLESGNEEKAKEIIAKVISEAEKS